MGLSLSHLIILAVFLGIIGFPITKILGRLGYSKVLVILAFIPIVNWIALWVLAFAHWPAQTNGSIGDTFR